MVIGQNGKAEDIELNVCKTKHLTNTRTSSSDEALRLTPPRILSLEQALDFIDKDELLEVTPVSLRIRKKELDSRLRKRAVLCRFSILFSIRLSFRHGSRNTSLPLQDPRRLPLQEYES